MTRHYESLSNRMTGSRDILPWLAHGFCTTNDRERVKAFFSKQARSTTVTKRNLSTVLKAVDRCIRLRQQWSTPFRQWMMSWKKKRTFKTNSQPRATEKSPPHQLKSSLKYLISLGPMTPTKEC